MTDTHSSDTQRVFSAETPPKISAQYTRSPEIENQIKEALFLSEIELAARLAIENFKSPDYLKGETLACLLSLAREENLPNVIDLISNKLAKVGDKVLHNLLKEKGLSENFIEEAVGELVNEMFIQILGRRSVSYDFWEVNFFSSLVRLMNNYLRKHAEKSRLTDTFSELSNDETEDEFDFERVRQKSETLTVEQKLEIKEILGKMSDENRRIFFYHRVEGWTQEQIAKVFGITARTVRNRLAQIDKFLEDFRNAQEEGK